MDKFDQEARARLQAAHARETLKKGELFVDVRALCAHASHSGAASAEAVGAEVEKRVSAWRQAGFRVHGILDGDHVQSRIFSTVTGFAPGVEESAAIKAAKDKLQILLSDANIDLWQAKSGSTEALAVLCYECATELRVGSSDVYVVAQSPELYFVKDIQYVPLHTLADDGSAEVCTTESFAQAMGIQASQLRNLALTLHNFDPSTVSQEDVQRIVEEARTGSLPPPPPLVSGDDVENDVKRFDDMLENKQAHPKVPSVLNGKNSNGFEASSLQPQQQLPPPSLPQSFAVPGSGVLNNVWHHPSTSSTSSTTSSTSSSMSSSSSVAGSDVAPGVSPTARSLMWNTSAGLASLETSRQHEDAENVHPLDEEGDALLVSAMRNLESPGGLLSGMLNPTVSSVEAKSGSGLAKATPPSSTPSPPRLSMPSARTGASTTPTMATGSQDVSTKTLESTSSTQVGTSEVVPKTPVNPWTSLSPLRASIFQSQGNANGDNSTGGAVDGTDTNDFGSSDDGKIKIDGEVISGLTMRECAEELAVWLHKEFGGSTKAAHLGRFYKANPEMAKIIKTMTLGHFVESNSDVLSWSPSSHVIAVAGEQPTPVLPEQSRSAAEAMVRWIRDKHGSQANSHALSMFYKAKPDLANVVRGQSLASFIRQNSDLMTWNPKTRVVTLVRPDKGPGAGPGTGTGAGSPGSGGENGVLGNGSSNGNGSGGSGGQGKSLASWIASENPTPELEEAFYTANPTLSAMVVAEWLQEHHNGSTNVANLGAFYRKHPVLAKLIRSQTLHNFTLEHSDVLRWNSKSRILSAVSGANKPSSPAGGNVLPISPSRDAATPLAQQQLQRSGGKPLFPNASAAHTPGLQPDGTSDGLTTSDRSAATAMAFWLENEHGGHTNAANLGAFYKVFPQINRHVKAKTLQVFINAVPDLLGWDAKSHIIWSARIGARAPPETTSAKSSAGAGNANADGGIDAARAPTSSGAWKKESLGIANLLANWLLEKSHGPYKASVLGNFYKENPEAAKVIKTRTLGVFCNDHPHLLGWNPKTYVLTVKRSGLASSRSGTGTGVSTPHRKTPLTVSVLDDDDNLHALCVVRTWLLRHRGAVSVSRLAEISTDHSKDYNVITLMGITTFCQRYPQWLVYDDASNRILLAELCS
ncbi:Hypothetical Protein FCC1311_030612 [Hondaea fermentalgiana]|uniref:Uncharacterized protein n=1 Tax=Hondaea fermentalgiana TaxID=2315210 RepID=A0A2R5G926_9STRA|nr:Hypothetical Protein FCC1311_030612 [Hondaea fermentalgiana]|eukprot:GBG26839.1 Hypothetical Protein FCC1311_030612 [Hondaea fermentalgiana]